MNKLTIFSACAALLLAACNKPALFEERKGAGGTDAEPVKKKVLVIAIEGARGQVVKDADMPQLKGLLQHSIYSWDAVCDTTSGDAASWSALFTGVTNIKNEIQGTHYLGHQLAAFPSFPQRLAANTALDITAVSSSPSLNDTLLKKGNANTWVNTGGKDEAARDSAVNRLKLQNPDLLVVAFNSVQQAGKAEGFNAAAPGYAAALKTVDGYIGDVLNAMRNRPTFANEDWLVIITSNHGGLETGEYGGNSFKERNIFLLYYHPGFTSRLVEMPAVNVPYDGHYMFFDRAASQDRSAYTNNPAYRFGAEQNFTIEFNIQSTYTGGTDHPVISNKNWGSGGNQGYVIYKQNGNIRLNYKGAAASRIDVRNGPNVSDGKWHRVSVVFNRLGTVDFYLDGKFFINGLSIAGKGNIDTGLPLAVGTDGTLNYEDGGTSGSGQNYIADIRVWNSALTPAAIDDWAFRPLNAAHPAFLSLIGHWKANELPTGNAIKDFSPTGADLTIQNNPRWDFKTDVLNPSSIDATLLVPRSMDLTSNVLAWMGVKLKAEWALDGKVEIAQ